MLAETHGRIDFRDGRFIARVSGEPTVVAELKSIQRCHWHATNAVWVIEPHWPSVRRLVQIAFRQRWNISAEARREIEFVESAGEDLEYSIDVVHDHQGHSRFRCIAGDDDDRNDEIGSIPGAYWEDEYWSVPTDWEHCCPTLREIVESDMRFTMSPAAELLLYEEDVSHVHIRTQVPLSVLAVMRAEPVSTPAEAPALSNETASEHAITRKPHVRVRKPVTVTVAAKRDVS